MPRTARIKTNDSIFHVMVRSVGDIDLYKDKEDKDKYLNLIKRYQQKFAFKVYAYCLMDNHAHILIDANGADISKFMHGINVGYAQYFNRKNKRHGHVFGDRFKSKIIKDDEYLLTVSAYIHNNPKDLKKFKKELHEYEYSSLGIYLGIREDKHKIVDEDYIMQFYSTIGEVARDKYEKLIYGENHSIVKKEIEFIKIKAEYRSERIILARDYTPEEVIEFVAKYTGINKKRIIAKHNRGSSEIKGLSIFLMTRLCDFNQRQICEVIGNITQSRVSKLCSIGLDAICTKKEYSNIVEDFIKAKAK